MVASQVNLQMWHPQLRRLVTVHGNLGILLDKEETQYLLVLMASGQNQAIKDVVKVQGTPPGRGGVLCKLEPPGAGVCASVSGKSQLSWEHTAPEPPMWRRPAHPDPPSQY